MTDPRAEQIGHPAELAAAVALVQEAHALSYALVMALAATPREELTRNEVDALCQLAFEVLNKLDTAVERFDEFDRSLQMAS
jgi:hypothetical protein